MLAVDRYEQVGVYNQFVARHGLTACQAEIRVVGEFDSCYTFGLRLVVYPWLTGFIQAACHPGVEVPSYLS